MIDEQVVRDSAKYLRNVRPIDPEEVADYVSGGAHPAVVRRTLREAAYDLGLREREDGTFVPVDPDPVPDPGWNPDSFPEVYAVALEEELVDEYGANWHVGESGDELRAAIRRLKRDYYHENAVEYDRTAALGYAIYHLPDYYAAIGYVLADLIENGLLERRLRVLDVGAGVGGPALGLHDVLPADAVVEYTAIEPSPAADVLETMLGATRRNFRSTIRRETAEEFLGLDGEDASRNEDAAENPYDLVLFGNVLSELDDPVAVVTAALDVLADDGSVVALAPADRNTATGLREIERAVVSGPSEPAEGSAAESDAESAAESASEPASESSDREVTVYSPTLRLWPGAKPDDRGWSFDVRPDLSVPPFQARLDEAAARGPTDEPGEFVNVDVQFAYAILRTDGRCRVDVRADPERHLRMADSEAHVTDRVDLLCVKLSHDLADGGNPLYKVSDGSETVDHYAVCTRETSLNRALLEADYGAVLAVENVLVLWNDDEEAYNLVVDDGTVVDLVAP
ncbi:small ribosomal subunit Rsm22 family protein [Halopenitus persicus]|uniref:Methyltransferase domain-containing protein n=1 Tax=Halopenitus persicus TaxID=1048396 RepID=A0A1H3K4F1_9EURY|nr:class I SAM-dependent methyltransferase [Halopenitus persicus]SDY46478.1 Methyltransferase domain-containing protein [Halopenitus persicus]